ncbi:MAG: hypothetical protein GX946_04765 [Oligosphaeraceae bacterium]|mgnify:CR=1 FL=1|jgi:hypothetical protein|nr:hypothetical protein [Oligosphaeraceae bacterium]
MSKICFPLLALLFFCSCAYHCGAPLADQRLQTLRIGDIDNLSSESSLTPLLKNALAERIAKEPGMRLVSGDNDQACVLQMRISDLDNRSLARAKLREKDERDYEGDAYQTVLYRIQTRVEYGIYTPEPEQKLLYFGAVNGQADLPKMHDREVALQSAMRQLAIDLANALTLEISEKK